MKEVIAVTDNIATAGAIVWWRLCGDTDVDRLSEAWDAAGLDMNLIPDTPAPPTALRRAISELKKSRRLIRPLEGHKGHALVAETAIGDDLDHDVLVTAKVDAVGRVSIEGDDAEKFREVIETGYWRHLTTLTTNDVSYWLAKKLMGLVDGVSLRDTGGMYFIPRTGLDTWRAFTDAISASSGHVAFTIPALDSKDAVEAILDALTNEASKTIEAIEGEVTADEITERKLDNRLAKCSEIEDKLSRYEKLLGRAMPAMAERLERLRANLAVAALSSATAGDMFDGLGDM